MDAPIFKRPHVTSLLETDSLLESLWKHNCTEQNVIHILKGVDDFCKRNGYSEIVIQYDGEELGLIVDAYDGEDNVDAETYWFEVGS